MKKLEKITLTTIGHHIYKDKHIAYITVAYKWIDGYEIKYLGDLKGNILFFNKQEDVHQI